MKKIIITSLRLVVIWMTVLHFDNSGRFQSFSEFIGMRQAATGADNKNGLFLHFGITADIKGYKHGQKLSVYFQRV